MHILEGEKSPDYSVLITDQILDFIDETNDWFSEKIIHKSTNNIN